MAIYHLSVKPLSRSAGRSSAAAAAYRSASRITDERTGEIFDFTKKRGVEQAEIVLPAGGTWQPSRSELWNSAEAAEKRKDACVAREHEVALPKELSSAQRLALAREYSQDLADRHGCAVDFAIHQPRDDAAPGAENWHAHVLCTTRVVDGNGLGQKCDREKAGRKRTEDLKFERQQWESICNKHLAAAGFAEQVDCRSLAAQGIEKRPGEHNGPAVSAMRRSQRSSRRADDQQRHHQEAEQAVAQRQAAETARDQATSERLRRRLAREPNRLHGESPGNRYARLDGLTCEDRQNGRSVWRFKPQPGTSLGAVAIVDHGDSISLPKTSDSRIGAAVALAKEKGWAGVVLTGSDEFKRKMTKASFEAGLTVLNPEMQDHLNELRRKAEEQQKAPLAPPAPPARPAATAPTPTLPEAQENPFSGLSPAELGARLHQVDVALEKQKSALKYADSIGYATQLNKEKRLKTQLTQAKAKVFEDGPMLRGVFSAHASLKFGEALETAQEDHRIAAEEIAAISNTHTLGRFLSAGKRRDAERRLADAQRRELEAAKRIDKIERAAQEMNDPKTREAYRRWAIGRMKEHNQDLARLEKLAAAAGAERTSIERKVAFNPGEYQRLTEEKNRLQELGNALAGDARQAFDVARDPAAEKQRQEGTAAEMARQLVQGTEKISADAKKINKSAGLGL